MKILSLFKAAFKSRTPFEKKIKSIVGFYPDDAFLYKNSLVHKSAAYDQNSEFKESNERLEFLGDAILGSIVAYYLYTHFPESDEGFLTKMRSKIVSRQSLNQLAIEIGLDQLTISKLDRHSKTDSIFGNAFEALVGAIYLDKGMGKAQDFIIKKVIEPYISMEQLQQEETNFKSRAIEWSQKERKELVFEIIEESGEGRFKEFVAAVVVDGEIRATGKEKSKKKAEQIASKILCIELGIVDGETNP